MKNDGIETLDRKIAKMDKYRVYLLNTTLLNYYKANFSHYEYNGKLEQIEKADGLIHFNSKEVYDFIISTEEYTFKMLDKNVNDMQKAKKAEKEKTEIQLLKEEVERLSKELKDERTDNCLTICKTQ